MASLIEPCDAMPTLFLSVSVAALEMFGNKIRRRKIYGYKFARALWTTGDAAPFLQNLNWR
jgi:hypothetical protein